MFDTGYYATGYYRTGYYTRSVIPDTLLGYTWYSLIFEVRMQLQDDQEGCYRYPDGMLLNALNRGLQDLGRMRPDAFFESFLDNDLNVPEITETNWTEEMAVDLMFLAPLIQYVAAQAEASEDDYVEDGRALGHMNMFRRYVMGL